MDKILRHVLLMSFAALGVCHFILTVYGHPEAALGIDLAVRFFTRKRDL